MAPLFLVTVLVTVANIPPSLLIAQLNGLIPCIHKGSVAICHSCSLSISGVLGGSTDLRVEEKPNVLHETVIENFQKSLVVKRSYSRATFRSFPITPSHSAATPK